MESEQLIETWVINSRVGLYLLDAVPSENLSDQLTSKGRNVGAQFAHIHNVRMMWLQSALPAAMGVVDKIDKDTVIDKRLLTRSLAISGGAIEQLIENAAADGGKVKGFKPHLTAFVGYLIAHEAHHRSQIIIALKQAGHPLDKKTLYGIWEWGSR